MPKRRRYTKRRSEDLARVFYYIPSRIDAGVERLAAQEGVSMSNMASRLLAVGIEKYKPAPER